MAHPNIYARRTAVQRVLDTGGVGLQERRALAIAFDCSCSAIDADVKYLNTGSCTPQVFSGRVIAAAVHLRDGERCMYCDRRDAERYIIEHVVPARRGGPTLPHNLVTACDSCNVKKGNDVWIPINLDAITFGQPEWRAVIRNLAVPDRVAA